jgi:acyl carrier protein
MALPPAVIAFINESAEREGQKQPQVNDDLFKLGVLDSFALVDFVTVLEEQCKIKVPDADINPGNFQSLELIERYVETRRATSP